ncbi:hypothetical protein FSP39_005715 [Pinctada imbricata]|uniref:Uncharacterized protein n=1 Tax=Pinctada imbricata TaxID=66713 RepID=A0AA88XY70_PINIB|nr:hypothetical protein FSP39_005715 [Pinctada imbricata]
MNLTDLKVPEKVGNVIKEVMSLCGKQPNAVPSESTVNRIVDSKLAVAHKQISDVLLEKKNTTLYTDETKKYGKCIQTYVLTDEDQTSYLLGLREMFNKSGQSTLDTLKEILEDFGTHCYQKERENHMNVGYRILANIRDTMSDRASTEKNFNHLLEDFRASILSQVVDNWDNMDEDQKKLCQDLITFFVAFTY